MKKASKLFFILLTVVLLFPRLVAAANCDQDYQCDENSDGYSECLGKQISCWQGEIDNARSEANTLQLSLFHDV